jgi:hypothetical protein
LKTIQEISQLAFDRAEIHHDRSDGLRCDGVLVRDPMAGSHLLIVAALAQSVEHDHYLLEG